MEVLKQKSLIQLFHFNVKTATLTHTHFCKGILERAWKEERVPSESSPSTDLPRGRAHRGVRNADRRKDQEQVRGVSRVHFRNSDSERGGREKGEDWDLLL